MTLKQANSRVVPNILTVCYALNGRVERQMVSLDYEGNFWLDGDPYHKSDLDPILDTDTWWLSSYHPGPKEDCDVYGCCIDL